MSIPKKIHYFWAGNKISKENLQNITAMKVENPGFSLNLWVNNKSLIKKTFDSCLNEFGLGEVFGCEFDKVDRGYVEEKDRSLIKRNGFFIRDIREAFNSLDRRFFILESMFYRNVNGYYHNYALASDIARLVVLYTEGGIYLDIDVKLKGICFDNINKEARFKNFNEKSEMAFGDSRGEAWKKNSHFAGNAILAAPTKSVRVFDILNIINNKIKDNLIQKYKLNQKYVDVNKEIPNPNKITPKPIYPKPSIQLKNFANPGQPMSSLDKNTKIDRWQNVSRDHPNWGKDTWCASRVIPDFRFDAAFNHTGPGVYQEYLKQMGNAGKPEVPACFRFENNGTELFEKVDAQATWRNTREPMIQKREFRYDDTEFPSSSNFILGDAEIMQILKKLNWI